MVSTDHRLIRRARSVPELIPVNMNTVGMLGLEDRKCHTSKYMQLKLYQPWGKKSNL